jgi:hypothetical protein
MHKYDSSLYTGTCIMYEWIKVQMYVNNLEEGYYNNKKIPHWGNSSKIQ